MYQSGFNVWPKNELPTKICQRLIFLQKWQNFAKSGHTSGDEMSFVDIRATLKSQRKCVSNLSTDIYKNLRAKYSSGPLGKIQTQFLHVSKLYSVLPGTRLKW